MVQEHGKKTQKHDFLRVGLEMFKTWGEKKEPKLGSWFLISWSVIAKLYLQCHYEDLHGIFYQNFADSDV